MKLVTLYGLLGLTCLAVGPGWAGCGDDGATAPCKDPALPHLCADGACHQCCQDQHCGQDEVCSTDHVCVPACLAQGEDCQARPGDCCQGFACDVFTNTCMTACSSADDCRTRTEIPFFEDLLCQNGVCVFQDCRNDSGCPPGQVCFDGGCVSRVDDCGQIASCQVAPDSFVVQEGTQVQFGASAYLTSGALAPGVEFEWTSSDDAVALVQQGLVTGGAQSGDAIITATVAGCQTTCTAEVINYAAVTGGSRVVVIDALTGEALAGVSVLVGTEGPVITDDHGAAVFTTGLTHTSPADVTVYREDLNYVTLRLIEHDDLIVPTTRLHHLDFSTQPPSEVAGGIRGKFDYSQVRCEEGHSCDVLVGLAGLSVPGSLLSLNFDLVFGGGVTTVVELGTLTEEVRFPSGLALCVNDVCPKEFYSPTAIPGTRAAWAIGGKVDLDLLIDKLEPILTGGEDVDVYQLVLDLLPLFTDFHTALVPNVEIEPIPMVEDVDDIDDDERTTYVPDYGAFPRLDMGVKVVLEEELTVMAPILQVGTYDGVIIVPGVNVRGAGFVPLGLGVGLDSTGKDDTADGQIDDPIVVSVADVAGRIPEDQFDRLFVAMAFNLENFAQESDEPMFLAGRIEFVNSFTGYHALDVFMNPPRGGYDPAERRLVLSEVPDNIDYTQVVFTGAPHMDWHVLGEWVPGAFVLPEAPVTGDRAESVSFTAVQLTDAVGDPDFQDLAAFNDTNLAQLMTLVKAFCYTEIPVSP